MSVLCLKLSPTHQPTSIIKMTVKPAMFGKGEIFIWCPGLFLTTWISCNKTASGWFGSKGHMFFQMKKSCFEGSEAKCIYTNKPLSLYIYCVVGTVYVRVWVCVCVCETALGVQLLSSSTSVSAVLDLCWSLSTLQHVQTSYVLWTRMYKCTSILEHVL